MRVSFAALCRVGIFSEGEWRNEEGRPWEISHDGNFTRFSVCSEPSFFKVYVTLSSGLAMNRVVVVKNVFAVIYLLRVRCATVLDVCCSIVCFMLVFAVGACAWLFSLESARTFFSGGGGRVDNAPRVLVELKSRLFVVVVTSWM